MAKTALTLKKLLRGVQELPCRDFKTIVENYAAKTGEDFSLSQTMFFVCSANISLARAGRCGAYIIARIPNYVK